MVQAIFSTYVYILYTSNIDSIWTLPHLSVVIFWRYQIEWSRQLNFLYALNKLTSFVKLILTQAYKNSILWSSWTQTGSTWNRSWDGIKIKMACQLGGCAICGAHSCCELALCCGCSTDAKSRYLSLTALTHVSPLAPPHTNASTGYDWSPAWVAHTKSCVSFVWD